MGKEDLAKLAGDDQNAQQYEAVYTAIEECGKDYAIQGGKIPNDHSAYEWLDKTPRSSITVQLVKKLHELGFDITKKQGQP